MKKLKIAQFVPPWLAVPPKKYGGTELIASYLAEGLVKKGHKVTLFASGDSKTKAKLVSVFPKALYWKDVSWKSPYEPLLHTLSCFEKAENFYLQNNLEGGKEKEALPKIKPSKEIFLRIKRILKKYVDTTELNYNVLTAWTLGTHFHDKFETFPLLILMARKQSGKTRTLKLVSSLSKGSDGSITI